MPMAIPTRSMSRKRTPRSRTKWRVPWVRLASHGAPMKPIHRPSSVETTYHSGGTDAVAMACICAAVLPAMAPGDEAEDHGAELADQEADDGVDEPHPALALGLRGDPRAYRGRGRRRRDGRRRRGRRDAGEDGAASAAGGTPAGSAGAGGRDAAAGRRRRLLDPFAGHVPGRDRPRRAGRRARWPRSRPAGLGIGHRQDVTGARRARDLQGDPPRAK